MKFIVETLMERRDMLAEYFSLQLSADGMVESLPLLLRDYTPNLDKLPSFLMRLGPQVRRINLLVLWGGFVDSSLFPRGSFIGKLGIRGPVF
jgi:hypothetical protein